MLKNTVQILMIGDAAVGKTSLTNRYAKKDFSGDYMVTLGLDHIKTSYCTKNDH